MKTLYIDCGMGAAGDMLMAALLELHPAPEDFLRRLNAALPQGVSVSAEPDEKCGIRGTHARVLIHGEEDGDEHRHVQEHEHEHEHGHHAHVSLAEIRETFRDLPLPENIRDEALAVYDSIARAESRVHGTPMENIHLHEVGSLDALADVLGVCMLMTELAPDRVLASPVHVGSGTVKCAHGILPVPAPATAVLLEGIPIWSGEIRGELCTPTGAALLRHFVSGFGPMPTLRIEKIGYGTGHKDFPQANLLRVLLGEEGPGGDTVLELSCNLDDCSGEELGYAQEALWKLGALDVTTTAIGMKKNRPGVTLSVLCREEQREDMLRCLFRHTSTLGVRESRCVRTTLERSIRTEDTPWGPVRIKTSEGWGVSREKTEYEDLARIAWEQGISLREAEKLVI